MLFTGISSLVQEYVIGTVFAYLLGNSIEQITVTIGVMMLGMGVGTFVQRFIKSAMAEWFLGIEIALVIITGFAPVFLQWAYVELPNDFGWIKFVYMFAPGVFIGMEIPLIMKINERFTRNLGKNISQTWAWDYVGGALGVVIWIWMLRSIDLAHISIWIAGCNLAVAPVACPNDQDGSAGGCQHYHDHDDRPRDDLAKCFHRILQY
jgi:spermidine synthase